MENVCTFLGELLVTAAMFAIPILCTCSFALGWDARVTGTLILLTMIDFCMFFVCVDDEVLKK
jgi:hypothetical protein